MSGPERGDGHQRLPGLSPVAGSDYHCKFILDRDLCKKIESNISSCNCSPGSDGLRCRSIWNTLTFHQVSQLVNI